MPDIINFANSSALIEGNLKNMIVPAGYVKISLSTKGKISKAPEVCFARCMTAAEVLNLSFYIKDDLQAPLISVLDSIIYRTEENKIASVAEWTPEEVIEFLIKYYSNFFGTLLTDLDYVPQQEELEWLKQQGKEELIKALETKMWQPKIQLDLSKVEFIPLPEGVSKKLTVIDEKEKFSVTFRFPYYGDILIVNEALKSFEGKEDTSDGAVFLTLLSNAVLMEKIQGTDISSFSLKDKFEMINKDPKLSLSLFARANKEFEKIKFGLNEEILVKSPITEKPTIRRFQFRDMDVLSSIVLYESNEYVVRFD